MSREWRFYLEDLIEFCERIRRYTAGLTRETFETDTLRYDATLRNIELIGEAARNLPPAVRQLAPEVPWDEIAGVRNILAHAYFGVDREIVWNIISEEIDLLLASLRRIEAQLDDDQV